jgi:hypothetical protein
MQSALGHLQSEIYGGKQEGRPLLAALVGLSYR